jgi:riboflavin kinase/FMN adenylyltransferase
LIFGGEAVEVVIDWRGIREKYPCVAVGLGNFDGVHLGHQKLIRELVQSARRFGGKALVFTFYPHPAAVLEPQKAPPLLLTPEAKEKMIARLGVDILLRVPFTPEFARTAPEDFVAGVLCAGLGARVVLVGYNYTFGYRGEGTAALLEELSEKYGFELRVVPPVRVGGRVVSSTLIRQLLMAGKVAEATNFLGYQPFVEGVVVPGDRRGSELGFPTANVEPDEKVLVPARGVYSVRVAVNGDTYLGVANVGLRPTFYDHSPRPGIEVHLLDFRDNLYGKSIRVHFVERLREERRFASARDLVEQIRQDIRRAREITPG